MLLLVDVGNTQTEIGVYSGKGEDGFYRATWRISTEKDDTADNICARLYPLFSVSGIDMSDISRAAVASVVPSLAISWQHAAKKLWGAEAILCSAAIASDNGLFEADYPHPNEIGSDRVADSIAARKLLGAPCIVLDFGTATNIEIIDAEGRFIGGIIAPGIMTGANALFSNATLISATGVAAPESVIGKSTSEAVRSGIIYGEAGRVDGLLDRIFEAIGGKCPVAATGGLCHTVSGLSKNDITICPELTLEGLRILTEKIEEG